MTSIPHSWGIPINQTNQTKKYTVISPLKVMYYKTKKGEERWFRLNFNQYRNTNGHQLGTVKHAYEELMKPTIDKLPAFNKIKLTYIVYTGSSHKSDVMNWISITDKFFQDCLVLQGKLPDDNFDYVPEVHGYFGGQDTKNPRIEIIIEPIN